MSSESPPNLLAVFGRDPGDAIVHATFVPNLSAAGIKPSTVSVLHTGNDAGPASQVFRKVSGMGSGPVLLRYLRLVAAIRRNLRREEWTGLYVRDVVSALLARIAIRLAFRRIPVLFDCRGDIAAEAELRGVTGVRLWMLRRLQASAVRTADRRMTISTGMAAEMTRLSNDVKVAVVPNLQSEVQEPLEHFVPRPLIVYAGGGQAWQDSNGALEGLKALADRGIDTEVITRDSKLANKARDMGLPVSSGDRDHVMSRLRAATASWMVRQAAAANAVASPVKLGEALAAGCVVVGSRATWEQMPQLENDGLAIIIDPDAPDFDGLERKILLAWSSGVPARCSRLREVSAKWTLRSHGQELKWFFMGAE